MTISTCTVAELLKQATAKLYTASATAALDAEIILAYTLKKDRSWLYAWPEVTLAVHDIERFHQLIAERAVGKPVAYIIHRQSFWSLELAVNGETLIPRPETELLVELILEQFNARSLNVLDLGTGTGAIALALAKERPHWQITGIDYCQSIIALAEKNAEHNQITNVNLYTGDWFDALPEDNTSFHIIVSNPPYISEDDPHLSRGDVRFEPQTALAAGKDGLYAIRKILSQAGCYLKKGGFVAIEHGHSQGAAVRHIFAEHGFRYPHTYCDLNKLDRVTTGHWHV